MFQTRHKQARFWFLINHRYKTTKFHGWDFFGKEKNHLQSCINSQENRNTKRCMLTIARRPSVSIRWTTTLEALALSDSTGCWCWNNNRKVQRYQPMDGIDCTSPPIVQFTNRESISISNEVGRGASIFLWTFPPPPSSFHAGARRVSNNHTRERRRLLAC